MKPSHALFIIIFLIKKYISRTDGYKSGGGENEVEGIFSDDEFNL